MKPKDEILRQLNEIGIKNLNDIFYNLSTPALYERAIRRREGNLSHLGPLVVRTGQHTGRSPNDKFIVQEQSSEDQIWWGKVNRPIDAKCFYRLYSKMLAYIQNKDVYIQDCYAGTDPEYRLPIRVITETAWHNLFARNLFVQAKDEEDLKNHNPEFTIVQMPSLHADPEMDCTNSAVFVVINFGRKLVLIGGSSYAGEIKKSVFSIMNYLLPQRGVMSMHCSANIGEGDDTAVLFGLSGTGKTTLSADPTRRLIGDDEHGWSDRGVFNYEGGCYAKVINLSEEAEPDIFKTTHMFGTILENVSLDSDSRLLDLDNAELTENTRAAYPLTHINNIEESGMGGHPKNIIMLTADAFGVLPPIAKLTPAQAMYHFISGYTAKVAGTEKGVTEPKATFSTCFGAPFMALHPSVYANLLGDKIRKHQSKCWLINTGWSGGPYGEGSRIKIKYTRAMLNAALSGKLDDAETYIDPFFGLSVPKKVEGVPEEVLYPKQTWKDQNAYDEMAKKLVTMFHDNFKEFEDDVEDEIKNAGPNRI
ncbi:MAG: phosphoenolpyruvate carboxykinase [Melioribacteraceae bacterium]|nr:phosphoenolpyruvate carboxykinase [Melioribacteraceae bacterium]MCF8356968.1 phosphoenolpyruvate carboxykinase [Melioribacteraceae bacterium]MCF8396003.1 phosphoenolpyruvate carboxykinase [Melioribacteraceae bacterium]MCF8420247.1 phosphoenolpyruvate carboxykinase [Melioribacteraceae bacterium]